MKTSEKIEQIASALHKAQAEMQGAKKTGKNPFFKSEYTTLEEVINCVRQPFADNGLSFHQFPITEEGRAGVETLLLHKSGEYISSEFTMKVTKDDPQGYGSCFTYARRYGLKSAAGLPDADDDGNAATRGNSNAKKEEPKLITTTQKSNVVNLIHQAGIETEQTIKAISWAGNGRTEKLDELTQPEAAKLIGFITSKIS